VNLKHVEACVKREYADFPAWEDSINMASYRRLLLMWDICCRAYPSLILYLTGRPPVDEIDCAFLCKKGVDDDQSGLGLQVGFSRKSAISLGNLLWCGWGRANKDPESAVEAKAEGWKNLVDGCVTPKLWTVSDPAEFVIPPDLKRRHANKMGHIYCEGSVERLTGAFLTMFVSKEFSYLKSDESGQLGADKSPTCMPLLFCQPSCNHRPYETAHLKNKVEDIIATNLSNPQLDYLGAGSGALCALVYKEQICGRMSTDDPRLIKPVMESLQSRTKIEVSRCTRATAVNSEDIKKLAKIFGITITAPEGLYEDFEAHADKMAGDCSGADASGPGLLRTKKEKVDFFKKRGEVCWEFSYLLRYLCKMFGGFRKLEDILGFHKVLAEALGVRDQAPPRNVPDLLEECRTYLHALTPLRIGLIEGLGRMLACMYHSRMFHPETNDASLIERYSDVDNDKAATYLQKVEDRSNFKQNLSVTAYLEAVTRPSVKVLIHNPVCFEDGGFRHDDSELSRQDMCCMADISKDLQGAATIAESTSLVSLLKGYFQQLSSKRDEAMENYFEKPIEFSQDMVTKRELRKSTSKRAVSANRVNEVGNCAIRLLQLVDYLLDEPTKELTKWIDDWTTDLPKFTWEPNQAIKDDEIERLGLTTVSLTSTRMILYKAFANIFGKQLVGVGPYCQKRSVIVNHAPTKTYELLAFVGLAMDYWYDNRTLASLQSMVTNNGAPSTKGRDHLSTYVERGCFNDKRERIVVPRAAGDTGEWESTPLNKIKPVPALPLFFPGSKDPFDSACLKATTFVYMNFLQKPSWTLLRTLQNCYIFHQCFRWPEPKPGVKRVPEPIKARLRGFETFKSETEYRFFVNCTASVVHAIDTFGLLLPYDNESIVELPPDDPEGELSNSPVKATASGKKKRKRESKGKGKAPQLTDPDLSGLEMALSPNAWERLVPTYNDSAVVKKCRERGANFQGLVSLIAFLLLRHPEILRFHKNTFDGIGCNGTGETGEKLGATRPADWKFGFCLFEHGIDKPVGYNLTELISLLLTGSLPTRGGRLIVTDDEKKRLKAAMDEYNYDSYRKAWKDPNSFCDVSPSGAPTTVAPRKILQWIPKEVDGNPLEDPEYLAQMKVRLLLFYPPEDTDTDTDTDDKDPKRDDKPKPDTDTKSADKDTKSAGKDTKSADDKDGSTDNQDADNPTRPTTRSTTQPNKPDKSTTEDDADAADAAVVQPTVSHSDSEEQGSQKKLSKKEQEAKEEAKLLDNVEAAWHSRLTTNPNTNNNTILLDAKHGESDLRELIEHDHSGERVKKHMEKFVKKYVLPEVEKQFNDKSECENTVRPYFDSIIKEVLTWQYIALNPQSERMDVLCPLLGSRWVGRYCQSIMSFFKGRYWAHQAEHDATKQMISRTYTGECKRPVLDDYLIAHCFTPRSDKISDMDPEILREDMEWAVEQATTSLVLNLLRRSNMMYVSGNTNDDQYQTFTTADVPKLVPKDIIKMVFSGFFPDDANAKENYATVFFGDVSDGGKEWKIFTALVTRLYERTQSVYKKMMKDHRGGRDFVLKDYLDKSRPSNASSEGSTKTPPPKRTKKSPPSRSSSSSKSSSKSTRSPK